MPGVAGFVARYPRVWHVIEVEGADCATLYPATTLRHLSGLPRDSANRETFRSLDLPGGDSAVLRPQLMPDGRLTPTLRGAFAGLPDRWRDHINQHVFFWVTIDRRDRFAAACAKSRNRGAPGALPVPVSMNIDTAVLLAAHQEVAFFSPINSGSTARGGARTRRDENTLRPIDAWRGERVAELAIRAPVPLSRAVATHAMARDDSHRAATKRQSSSASTK
jgi:hypothetical protein